MSTQSRDVHSTSKGNLAKLFIYFLIGLILMVGTLFMIYDAEQERLLVTEPTQATVIGVYWDYEDNNWVDYKVQFTDKNSNRITTSISGELPNFDVGDKISILYDPKHPTNAHYISSSGPVFYPSSISSVLGIMWIIVGGIITVFSGVEIIRQYIK